MKVVLDSNIFFSALLSPHGIPHHIYEAWRDGRFQLVTCEEQLEEIRRASRYPKFHSILQPHLVGLMLNNLQGAEIWTRFPQLHQASDPTDSFLLNLSIASKAHYLVTGDKRAGLLNLKKIDQTKILTADSFCTHVLKIFSD